jgi:hypothetical protein
MFERIQQYELIDAAGIWYRPRIYGAPRLDGTWDGWLVFFPLSGGTAIAPSGPETTQSTVAALTLWAAGLTPVYLEGALARARGLAQQTPLIARLTDAEYEALADAQRLETAAELERTAADLDDAAASAARADAERIRRERLATEGAIAATEEAAANIEADIHEKAARDARAVAADAERRRRARQSEATPRRQTTPRGAKTK